MKNNIDVRVELLETKYDELLNCLGDVARIQLKIVKNTERLVIGLETLKGIIK